MYGQMTAGQLDLHRHAGHPAGHLRDARLGGPALLRQLARRARVRVGRPRRHGRRAAAGGDDERRRGARRRSRSDAHRAAPRDEVRRRGDRQPRRGAVARGAVAARRRGAVGRRCCANAADVLPALVARNVVPDLLTDQTSAHDPLNGYVPNGMTLADAEALAPRRCRRVLKRVGRGDGRSRARDARAAARGAVTFDYGNNIRAQAVKGGVANAFDIPGLRAGVHPPAVLRGQGAVPMGGAVGRPCRHPRDRSAALEMFPADEALCRWIQLAPERVAFQGLPARIFWLGYGERARFGLEINELVRTRRRSRRRSSSAAITWTPARSRRRTAKPRPCATAATPSPTGRFSTRC